MNNRTLSVLVAGIILVSGILPVTQALTGHVTVTPAPSSVVIERGHVMQPIRELPTEPSYVAPVIERDSFTVTPAPVTRPSSGHAPTVAPVVAAPVATPEPELEVPAEPITGPRPYEGDLDPIMLCRPALNGYVVGDC
jgi:hypothetical protein